MLSRKRIKEYFAYGWCHNKKTNDIVSEERYLFYLSE